MTEATMAPIGSVVDAPPSAGAASACEVVAISPDQERQWTAYVERHMDGTFFHTLAWRNAVRDAFGHDARYLLAFRGHKVCGVLPLFHIASRFTGSRLVSVPYGVGGGIIADDECAAAKLFDAARQLVEERSCDVMELRSARASVSELPIIDRYVGFERALPSRVEDVLGALPRKARAAARNARDKFGLTVSVGDVHLRTVWQLYAESMRRLGSLTYPYRFFGKLVEETPGRHWVSLVHWGSKPVAGLVTFLFRDRVLPYFIGTSDDARRCSAANFIYLAAMERGVRCGYRVFDFGRSRRGNVGSYDFKRFNGFEPTPLEYQHYVPGGRTAKNLTPDNPAISFVRSAWRHLPLCVTKYVGAKVSRHVPG